jgi:NADH-quinone oxidoreductase subunit M
VICFTTQNLLLFLFCFESTAVFLFLVIQQNIFEPRRILASYFLFFYTLMGSLPFLRRIIFNYKYTHALTFNSLRSSPEFRRYYLFRGIRLTFLIKLPCIIFYIWLIEAHVEASTAGSIILARIILKIGRYGFFKILICNSSFRILLWFQPSLILIFSISFFLRCLHLFTHTNLKKIIAFSSIRHMNIRFLSLFCFYTFSYTSFMLFLITHSIIRTRLFFLRGKIRIETQQKNYNFFSGLIITSPFINLRFGFFIFSNFNFPLTRNFFPEILFFINLNQYNFCLTFIVSLFTRLFSICWLYYYTNMFFGQVLNKIVINLTLLDVSFLGILSFYLCIIRLRPNFLFK